MKCLIYIIIVLSLASACATTSTLHTNPPNAEVFINGKRCNVSPCIHHSRYGFPDRIRIQIQADDFKQAEFFLDTEAPLPSYLLFGLGAYIFHAFQTEYFFELYPSSLQAKKQSKKIPESDLIFKISSDPLQVATIIEKCLYWKSLKSNNVWKRRFFKRAEKSDCSLAKATMKKLSIAPGNLSPSLARVLLRYQHKKQKVKLPWKKPALCQKAIISYAKRIGANRSPEKMPAFKALCSKEHKQLMSP